MRPFAPALVFLAVHLVPVHLGLPAAAPDGLRLVPQAAEAARFGGGRSFGFRGSRGLFGGARSFRPRTFGTPRSRFGRRGFGGYYPRRGFGGGLFGGLGGFLLGGFLGSMLFGGMGYGGGGVGLIGILLIVGGFFLILRFLSGRVAGGGGGRRAPGYAGADPYGVGGGGGEPGPYESRGAVYRGPDIAARGGGARPGPAAAAPRPAAEAELAGIAAADPGFSREDFLATARQNFLRFQEAWTARDIGPIRDLLDKDIASACERDIEDLRRAGRINRLDRIEIRSLEVAEAWQEEGYDFVTVRCEASLYDYVVAEATGEIVEGSREEPVAFAERWTWARPSGPGRWFLSAIEQE